MAPLPSFAVTGNVYSILGNTSGSELVGNTLTSPQVTFVSNVESNTFVTWGDALYRVAPVYATVNADGEILRNGETVRLLADDPGLNVEGLQWRVDIPGGKSFWFNAPTDGATVDLADVVPVPNVGVVGTTKGDPGDPVDAVRRVGDTLVFEVDGTDLPAVDISDLLFSGDMDDITDATTVGKAVVRAVDQAAARTAIAAADTTTVAGKAPNSRQVATQHSLTGGGDLTANRTLSLVNDTATPGNNKLYGTDGSGTRGWYTQPAGGGGGGDASTNTSTSVDSEIAVFSGTAGKTLKRATQTGILKATSGVIGTATAGTDYYAPGGADVSLADGGTGTSLTDPNVDRIMFWDDSAGQIAWLAPGTNLSITGTTLNASSSGMTLTFAPNPSGDTSGATDATALNTAITTATSAGQTLWFPDGTYYVNSTVHFTCDFRMTNKTIIMAASGFTGVVADTPFGTSVSKPRFHGGVFDANNTAVKAFWFHSCSQPVWTGSPTFRNTASTAGSPGVDLMVGDPADSASTSGGIRLYDPQFARTVGSTPVGGINLQLTTDATDAAVYNPRGNGQECAILNEGGGNTIYSPHHSNVQVAAYIDNGKRTEWVAPIVDNIQQKTHSSASASSGASTVTDTSIAAIHKGLPVTGTNIPNGTYVGTVTAGTSFTLVDKDGDPVTTTGSVSGVTLKGVGVMFLTDKSSVLGGHSILTDSVGADNSVYVFCFGPNTTDTYIWNFRMLGQVGGTAQYIAPATGKKEAAKWMGLINDSVAADTTLPPNQFARSPRIATVTSNANPTLNTDNTDQLNITALAVAVASMTTNLSGSPYDGQPLRIRFKDNGTGRAITWGSAYSGNLLTTTVANKTHVQELVYDEAKSKWAGTFVDTSGY